MKQLKIAVVGIGFIGDKHARIIHECPSAKLVAVMDVNEISGREVAQKYNCKYYSDLGQLLQQEEIDAVDICTPEEYHLSSAKIAAAYKKDILLEKPVAKTWQDALEIQALEKTYGIRVMVGHILHFDPRYVALKESVDRGELGEIVSMFFRRANWQRTVRRLEGKVSFLYYMCVHDIEWMLSYNKKAKPVKVYAQGVSWINRDVNQQDVAFITVNFDDGSLGCIEVMWAMPENTAVLLQTGVEMLGTKGVGFIDGRNQGLQLVSKDQVSYPDLIHWPEYNGQIRGDLKDEIHHFVEATLDKKPYLVDTNTAVLAIKIIEFAFESMASGMPVDL